MKFDPDFLRDVALAVYRQRLNDSQPRSNLPQDYPYAADLQVTKDGDDGAAQRERAAAYDCLARPALVYLFQRGCLTADALAAVLPPKEKSK
jgi:hypothetical protein